MAPIHNPPKDGPGYLGYNMQMQNRIHKVNGYGDGAGGEYTYYPALIIGAGESGIAMGYKLKHRLGFDQFRIFDRQGGVGGTWWINRYPGIACDVPAVFYSFSFAPNPRWTTFYPPGPEIYRYLQDVCDRFGITEKIELNTDVLECRWLEQEEQWEVKLQHFVAGTGDLCVEERELRIKEQGKFSVYVSTETVEPKAFPDNVPGLDKFKGPIFHSARWDYNVDLTDKNVLVVGTGCSAAQVVPKLTHPPFNVKSVTQLMKSPPWVVQRLVPPGGNKTWAKYSPIALTWVPGLMQLMRFAVFALGESDWVLFGSGKRHEKARKRTENAMLRHMRETVPSKYHEILTPDYSVACKRRIYDATWFPSLNDPKINLTTLPLTSLQEDSVTLGPGRCYPPKEVDSEVSTEQINVSTDVIVLANGFEVHHWLHPLKITGKDGKDLIDTMMERGGPQAYQGTAMDGFPNFQFIAGPNTITGHTSVVLAIENMTDYTLRFVKLVLRGDARTFDVKKDAEVAYTQDLQAKMKDTVWMKGGCSSWYFTDGWNSTVLPYSQVWFWYRCQFTRWNDWNIQYTRKGLIKLALARGMKVAALFALGLALYRARQGQLSPKQQVKALRGTVLSTAVSLLDTIRDLLSRYC